MMSTPTCKRRRCVSAAVFRQQRAAGSTSSATQAYSTLAAVWAIAVAASWATVKATVQPTSSPQSYHGQLAEPADASKRPIVKVTSRSPQTDKVSDAQAPLVIKLDRFGRCQLDGQAVERILLRQKLREALTGRAAPTVRLVIAAGALPEDAEELRDIVEDCGLDNGRIETQQAQAAPMPSSDRQAAARFFQGQLDLQRTLWERIGQQQQRLTETLHDRWADLRRRVSSVAHYVAPLRLQLDDMVRGTPATRPAR
jgi:hypothetical protein